MKKYDLILKISFINYILAAFASPYMTAQIWADIIFILFIISCCYQLIYVFFLRKKENKSFLKSIATSFLYFSYAVDLYIVFNYMDMFFNGYSNCFIGSCNKRYYGFEALSNSLESIIFIPSIIFCFIYQVSYFRFSKKLDSKVNKMNREE